MQSFRLLFLYLSHKIVFIEKAIFLFPLTLFCLGFCFSPTSCCSVWVFLGFFSFKLHVTLNSVGFPGISMDEYKQVFFILNASLEVAVFSLIFMYKHGFKIFAFRAC